MTFDDPADTVTVGTFSFRLPGDFQASILEGALNPWPVTERLYLDGIGPGGQVNARAAIGVLRDPDDATDATLLAIPWPFEGLTNPADSFTSDTEGAGRRCLAEYRTGKADGVPADLPGAEGVGALLVSGPETASMVIVLRGASSTDGDQPLREELSSLIEQICPGG